MKYLYWEIDEAMLWKCIANKMPITVTTESGQELFLEVHKENPFKKDEE